MLIVDPAVASHMGRAKRSSSYHSAITDVCSMCQLRGWLPIATPLPQLLKQEAQMGPYGLHKPKTSKQVSQLSHAIWTASAMLVPLRSSKEHDSSHATGVVTSASVQSRRVHPPTAHTPIPPNQKIDFSHTVYNTNN
jgi:hypothetical protein